jgi:predicted secreted acid phosphatase
MNEYMKIMRRKSDQAVQIVYDYRLKHPDADNLAVVFDIDGTLLNDMRTIEPVVEFYNICKRLGYHVFIITARDSHGVSETINQLKTLGITGYESIYFRLPTYWDMAAYKESSRKSIRDKGYDTVLSIGDNQWDVGKYGGYGILLPGGI